MNLSSHFVFCDDIRREDNGKLIIIGAYPEDLVPGVLPQTVFLSIWASIRGVPEGSHECVISLGVNGDEQIRQGGLKVVCLDPSAPLNLTLLGLPARLESPGKVVVTLESATWPTAATGALLVREPRSAQGA